MSKIKVLGVDPSFSNFGMVRADIDTETLAVDILWVQLIETENEQAKGERKSHDDLRRAKKSADAYKLAQNGVHVVMAEIPTGSKSARACKGAGVCIGILSSTHCSTLIEVNPTEVKMASVGNKNATKEQMIAWATKKYPGTKWMTRISKGNVVYLARNEHIADAIAVIHASIQTASFQEYLAGFRKAHSTA